MRRSPLAIALFLSMLPGCVATVGGDGPVVMGSASDTLEDRPATPTPLAEEQDLPARIPFGETLDARTAEAMIRAWTAPEPLTGLQSFSPPRADPDLRREALSGAVVGSLRRAIAMLDLLPEEFAPSGGDSPDPLGDAFVGNVEDVYIPPERFVPFTGSFDLSAFEGGAVYSRAWTRDQAWRGMGLGVAFPLGKRWRGAAECGFDPFSTLHDGRVTLLLGFSRDL